MAADDYSAVKGYSSKFINPPAGIQLHLTCSSYCVMVLNIFTQGSFLSEIKPFRRSHMIF